MFRRLLTFLFYFLFVLAAIGVCLVLLFPRDKFLNWASSYIEQRLPGIHISMGDLKYVHPLKLRLYELTISDDQKEWEIPVDTLLLSVEPRYPIDHIGVIGVLFGGDLSFELSRTTSERLELRNLKISEVLLSELKLLEKTIDRPVEGIVSLSGRATVDRRRLGDIRFNGTMRLERFQTSLRQPVLDQNEVRFDRVDADIVLNGKVVDLTGGRAEGPLLSGNFSGQIRGTIPMSRSEIRFSGDLVPQPALLESNPALNDSLSAYFKRNQTDSIPYSVDGTISEPFVWFREP